MIPLVVICGPTASGKTKIGAALARELDGEVISADSMQIYKDMGIVTAVPTEEEMLGVPHHLISILDTGTPFSAADYVRLADKTAEDIFSRGKLPVVVGGTGLYISSLADGISFEDTASDGSVRKRLEQQCDEYGIEPLYSRLALCDPEAAENIHINNKKRVIRALELYEVTGRTMRENMELSRKNKSRYSLCMIGLDFEDRSDLYDRINRRVDIMIADGMAEQAKKVWEKGGLGTAAQAIGYKELIPYFEGREDLSSCIDKIKQSTRHYAKRQLTWFRRDARISWIKMQKNDQSDKIIQKCLNIVAKSKIICYNNK